MIAVSEEEEDPHVVRDKCRINVNDVDSTFLSREYWLIYDWSSTASIIKPSWVSIFLSVEILLVIIVGAERQTSEFNVHRCRILTSKDGPATCAERVK